MSGGNDRPVNNKSIPSLSNQQQDAVRNNPSASEKTKSVLDILEEHQQQQLHHHHDRSSSWFLFQLPTRLPPIRPKVDPPIATTSNSELNMDTTTATATAMEDIAVDANDMYDTTTTTSIGTAATTSTTIHTESIVSTPPVDTEAFDNALISAPPGRLGKLRIHASGKVVLHLQDDDDDKDGSGNGVVWNVREGLSCGFLQKAVCIDLHESQFVPLGHVKMTLVATPDLSKAFASSSSTT
jgi:hypothetical protein